MRRLASVAVLVGLGLVPAAASAPTDYPDIATFVPVPAGAYGQANRPSDLFIGYVVIHDTEGNYPGTVSIFTNPSACCSVHYLVDGESGASYPAVTQFVHDEDIAYHAGNFWFNQHSIGIEHDGFADGPVGFYTAQMYQRSAKLAAWIAFTYRIPLDRAHFVSHANVPAPFQSLTNAMHWDPGPFWDWPYYFALIRGQYTALAKTVPPPTPKVPKQFRKERAAIRTIDVGRLYAATRDVTDWSSGQHTEFANVYASPPNELVLGASDSSTWTSPSVYNARDFSCDNLPNVTSAQGMDQNSDQRAKADWGEAFVLTGTKKVGGIHYDRIWFAGVSGWVKHMQTRDGWGVIVTFRDTTTLYGKPILDPANEICPDAQFGFSRTGQAYVAQIVYKDPTAVTWYGIYYNHRLAWVPASEVTIR